MTPPNAAADAAERARRTEFVRETKAAIQNGETLEQRTRKYEDAAVEWSHWVREKMKRAGAEDPVELLPDILARIDQTIDDRVAAALRELKASLTGALK
jgi:hypothetical protein